jgi:hypothetical protein
MIDQFLVNSERDALDGPLTSSESEPGPLEGWWPGSATSHVERWRRRALAAERELAEIRADIGLTCEAWDR